jgi:hypothetical protein
MEDSVDAVRFEVGDQVFFGDSHTKNPYTVLQTDTLVLPYGVYQIIKVTRKSPSGGLAQDGNWRYSTAFRQELRTFTLTVQAKDAEEAAQLARRGEFNMKAS